MTRYYELVSVHGELQPLIDIKLKPKTKVKLRFVLDELVSEKDISVYKTVRELKVYIEVSVLISHKFLNNIYQQIALEPIFGIQPCRMKLFYQDMAVIEGYGWEEMRFPGKQLYSYNMHDGDEIHVSLKG